MAKKKASDPATLPAPNGHGPAEPVQADLDRLFLRAALLPPGSLPDLRAQDDLHSFIAGQGYATRWLRDWHWQRLYAEPDPRTGGRVRQVDARSRGGLTERRGRREEFQRSVLAELFLRVRLHEVTRLTPAYLQMAGWLHANLEFRAGSRGASGAEEVLDEVPGREGDLTPDRGAEMRETLLALKPFAGRIRHDRRDFFKAVLASLKERGWQQRLAERFGVTAATVSRWLDDLVREFSETTGVPLPTRRKARTGRPRRTRRPAAPDRAPFWLIVPEDRDLARATLDWPPLVLAPDALGERFRALDDRFRPEWVRHHITEDAATPDVTELAESLLAGYDPPAEEPRPWGTLQAAFERTVGRYEARSKAYAFYTRKLAAHPDRKYPAQSGLAEKVIDARRQDVPFADLASFLRASWDDTASAVLAVKNALRPPAP